jgi:integrase
MIIAADVDDTASHRRTEPGWGAGAVGPADGARAEVVDEASRGQDVRRASRQLRHHYASLLLADGVDVRTLAEYLGHSDPGFTLRVYCHLLPSGADRARRAVEMAFADDENGPVTAQGKETGP